MTFVYQDEIVTLKCIDGDGLIAHFVLKFVDVKNLYCLSGEQTSSILVEELRRNPSEFEFAQMLLAQTLIRGEQDDAIEFPAASVLFQIELILKNVGVHQQRLAASRGAP